MNKLPALELNNEENIKSLESKDINCKEVTGEYFKTFCPPVGENYLDC
jgi:hypothetical protein